MATVAAAARGAGARAVAGLRSGGGAVARERPRAGRARRLCTAPAAPAAVDMKSYLWARYHEAKRSTDGECASQLTPPTRGPLGSRAPYLCRAAPAGKATLKLRNSCFSFSPAGVAVSYLGIVKPRVCIGSALGRREGSKGVGRKTFPQTPLGVVIHPGNDSSSPACCALS